MPDPDLPRAQQVAILRSDAEGAYVAGNDRLAAATADVGLRAAVDMAGESGVAEDLAAMKLVRVRALVRGGDPKQALQSLAKLGTSAAIDDAELWALRAVAHDRAGDRKQAVFGYAHWRASLDPRSAESAYAEQRLKVLLGHIPAARLVDLSRASKDTAAAACLRGASGQAAAADAPPWVRACRQSPRVIAILLPRSGKLAALADTQLAAATAAVAVLSDQRPAVQVLWRDTKSTTQGAVLAARAAMDAGAETLVGPMAPASIKAVRDEVGPRISLISLGEQPDGVATAMETRVAALVAAAPASKRGLVTAVPDNAYGRRVAKAAMAELARRGSKAGKTISYPPNTTSFKELRKVLEPGHVLLIGDHVGRVELIVRQVRRWLGDAAPILATAEGLTPDSLRRSAGVLDGVLVAPAAVAAPADAEFVARYTAVQGQAPGDQALLVHRALGLAFGSSADSDDPARQVGGVLRVEGGQLVRPQAKK